MTLAKHSRKVCYLFFFYIYICSQYISFISLTCHLGVELYDISDIAE